MIRHRPDTHEDIYRTLQRRINELPVPFPETRSGVELRLLRALFTEEEAEAALALSAVAEPLEVIERRLSNTGRGELRRIELGRVLAGMAEKGAIHASVSRVGHERVPTYGLAPLVVGMFEFQVNRLTPDFVRDFHQYLDEGFRSAVVGAHTGQIRTVPVRAGLASARTVARYHDIRSYLAAHPGPFSVINCVCRQAAGLLGRECTTSSSHETCLVIGRVASDGREIDHDELFSILDRAEKEGHVLQPQNSRRPGFICCCCRDCCEVLENARKLPRPADAIPTAYSAVVNTDLCTGCRSCVRRCPMGAVHMDVVNAVASRPAAGAGAVAGTAAVEGTGVGNGSRPLARVDADRCIGCGLCATTCPVSAITLVRRRKRARTPRSNTGMYLHMYADRRGVLGLVGIAIRKLLGLRI